MLTKTGLEIKNVGSWRRCDPDILQFSRMLRKELENCRESYKKEKEVCNKKGGEEK